MEGPAITDRLSIVIHSELSPHKPKGKANNSDDTYPGHRLLYSIGSKFVINETKESATKFVKTSQIIYSNALPRWTRCYKWEQSMNNCQR